MKSFDEFYEVAAGRKGGEEALERLLPVPKTCDDLAATADHRILSTMTRTIFQAGFVWRVVDAKWDGFEEVFQGFQPPLMDALPEDVFEAISQDQRIIRNRQKVLTVPRNARFILDIAEEHGSMAQFLANWPEDNIIGLWTLLKKRGHRLGGFSGPRVLRVLGKDTFLLTSDVVEALTQAGVVSRVPSTQTELRDVQAAFNAWRETSGRPLCQISKVLSCSVGKFLDDPFL